MIYFDNAATTAVKKEVLEKMLPYFSEHYGNASSIYSLGRESAQAVAKAREQVSNALHCKPTEIYFTGCGSEADNWAIKGVASANRAKGKHIITTAIEHHAVLHTCQYLEKLGFEVTYLPVDEYGTVSLDALEKAIRDDTILISVMFANNEIGTIQPIKEIGEIARKHKILFHTDAVQAVGAVEIDVNDLGVDLLSLSAHKFGGPKGVGALFIRNGVRIDNFMHGGAQEKAKRAGTENLAGIVGLGEAIELACADIPKKTEKIAKIRDYIIDNISKTIPHSRLNGHPTNRLCGNVNFSFEFIEGEGMLLHLDMLGIAASSGSACTSGSLDPSHVLLAIGLPHGIAHGSLRISIGEANTMEEADRLLEVLPVIIQKLRDMSPLYDASKN